MRNHGKDLKYRRLYEELAARIRNREFLRGTLPAESTLSEKYGISRNGVRQAMELLLEDGLVIKSRGRKTEVNPHIYENPAAKLKLLFLYRHHNPIYFEIQSALFYEAIRRGARVEALNLASAGSAEMVAQYAEMIREADGIFITHLEEPGLPAAWTAAIKTHPHSIAVDIVLSNLVTRSVGTDNYGGGRLAAEYLLRTGCRYPVILATHTSLLTYSPLMERCLGFHNVMREAGYPLTAEQAVISVDSDDFGYLREQLGKLFNAPRKPDAIFCLTDFMATAVACMLETMAIRVPEEVALIGFDGVKPEPGAQKIINLTTVRQNVEEIGRRALEVMLERLLEKRPDFGCMKIAPVIQIGDTTRNMN